VSLSSRSCISDLSVCQSVKPSVSQPQSCIQALFTVPSLHIYCKWWEVPLKCHTDQALIHNIQCCGSSHFYQPNCAPASGMLLHLGSFKEPSPNPSKWASWSTGDALLLSRHLGLDPVPSRYLGLDAVPSRCLMLNQINLNMSNQIKMNM
jgi:hypothetical protein